MMNDSPKSRERPWLTWGLGLVAVALMAAILIPRLGGQLWWVQSLNFAQVQFAMAVPTFYGLHPKPPLGNSIVARGDAEILFAGREIRQRTAPALLAGDLNDVPWSHTLQRFQKESKMRDPRVGRGLYPTYKTKIGRAHV